MTDAPERIWVHPPYYTIAGEIPKIEWVEHWDADMAHEAQAFNYERYLATEYTRTDVADAMVAAAVKAEREACLEIIQNNHPCDTKYALHILVAIRNRGNDNGQ